MKKLLSYLVVLTFVLGIMIIGRPAIGPQHKGEDFFIVDYGKTADDIGGFWMKGGVINGFATVTKEKADEMFKKWKLDQRKTKTEI